MIDKKKNGKRRIVIVIVAACMVTVALICCCCLAGCLFSDSRVETRYAPSVIPTLTLVPTLTTRPLPLETELVVPTEVPETTAPISTDAPPVTATLSPMSTKVPIACSCSGNTRNCSDFSTREQAQACYDYCVSQGRGDIHQLDHDHDGEACEMLP